MKNDRILSQSRKQALKHIHQSELRERAAASNVAFRGERFVTVGRDNQNGERGGGHRDPDKKVEDDTREYSVQRMPKKPRGPGPKRPINRGFVRLKNGTLSIRVPRLEKSEVRIVRNVQDVTGGDFPRMLWLYHFWGGGARVRYLNRAHQQKKRYQPILGPEEFREIWIKWGKEVHLEPYSEGPSKECKKERNLFIGGRMNLFGKEYSSDNTGDGPSKTTRLDAKFGPGVTVPITKGGVFSGQFYTTSHCEERDKSLSRCIRKWKRGEKVLFYRQPRQSSTDYGVITIPIRKQTSLTDKIRKNNKYGLLSDDADEWDDDRNCVVRLSADAESTQEFLTINLHDCLEEGWSCVLRRSPWHKVLGVKHALQNYYSGAPTDTPEHNFVSKEKSRTPSTKVGLARAKKKLQDINGVVGERAGVRRQKLKQIVRQIVSGRKLTVKGQVRIEPDKRGRVTSGTRFRTRETMAGRESCLAGGCATGGTQESTIVHLSEDYRYLRRLGSKTWEREDAVESTDSGISGVTSSQCNDSLGSGVGLAPSSYPECVDSFKSKPTRRRRRKGHGLTYHDVYEEVEVDGGVERRLKFSFLGPARESVTPLISTSTLPLGDSRDEDVGGPTILTTMAQGGRNNGMLLATPPPVTTGNLPLGSQWSNFGSKPVLLNRGHSRCTTLNGSNGEYTGSDDVVKDDPKARNDTAKRTRKEAENTLHRRASDNRTNKECASQRIALKALKDSLPPVPTHKVGCPGNPTGGAKQMTIDDALKATSLPVGVPAAGGDQKDKPTKPNKKAVKPPGPVGLCEPSVEPEGSAAGKPKPKTKRRIPVGEKVDPLPDKAPTHEKATPPAAKGPLPYPPGVAAPAGVAETSHGVPAAAATAKGPATDAPVALGGDAGDEPPAKGRPKRLKRKEGRVYFTKGNRFHRYLDLILKFYKLPTLFTIVWLSSLIPRVHVPSAHYGSWVWLVAAVISGLYSTSTASEHIAADVKADDQYKPVDRYHVFYSHGGVHKSYFGALLSQLIVGEDNPFYSLFSSFCIHDKGNVIEHTEDGLTALGLDAYIVGEYYPLVYDTIYSKYISAPLNSGSHRLFLDLAIASFEKQLRLDDDYMQVLKNTVAMVYTRIELDHYWLNGNSRNTKSVIPFFK